MKFKIHRGAKEIGGSCVEVWTKTTRIIIDFGMPLVNSDKTEFDFNNLSKTPLQTLIDNGILPNIQSLYLPETKTALILSHAHQDHYGLINYLHNDSQVHLGKATHKLIELTNIFSNKNWTISNPNYFESSKTFSIGDIEVTPYLMDHSAFDAYAFLIKSNGKSLFYSGDFRTHGRKSKVFDWFCHNVTRDVDYLLLEGTTIGRSNQKSKTEAEIETDFVETFNHTKGINLIYTSGQNIDRLVSIYRACKKTGKILAIDFYIATIITEIAKLGYKIPYPSSSYPEIKVFYPNKLSSFITRLGKEVLLFRFKKYKITKKEIDESFEKTVMLVRPSMLKDMEHLESLKKGVFIYSMWSGYKKEVSTRDFIEYLKNRGMTTKDVHTSGHADLNGLKKMVEALKPKNIIPIHTFNGESYESVFQNVKVVLKNDGEEVVI